MASASSTLRLLPLIAALALAACGKHPRAGASGDAAPARDSAVQVVDDAGRTLRLDRPARRIVSLVPAATEVLMALGATDRLAGRTDFDHGPGLDSLPSVGGGLDPSLEKLVALHPDLVVGWESGGGAALHERLAGLGIPFASLKTEDTTDVFRSIQRLGTLTGRAAAADSVARAVRGDIDAVRASVAGLPRPSVFFVVWYDPPMTAGPKTFITQLIEVAGGRSAFADAAALWPNVSLEEVVRRQPQVVIVPTGEKGAGRLEELRTAPGWRELKALQGAGGRTVPAELVNRPGPRIGQAARALRDAIHPEAARR